MRTNLRIFSGAELVLESVVTPLDLARGFARSAPLEVDLGCGDGAFLVALAEGSPDRNFLGVEQMVGRVRGACRKIGDRALPNARILRLEISHSLSLFPRGSVDVFHLLFPDPWPKRRHHVRRVVTPEFLRAAARALAGGGIFQIKTDQEDYLGAMKQAAGEVQELEAIVEDEHRPGPTTTFEERFRAAGLPIFRLTLRKVSVPRGSMAATARSI
ncbi:MAG: tRNA (guanosine(46)-N7)-methyltransferase TrmB [Verrucomicrobiota bacterium]|nr:tRNA (guanosine(46)-N7)-methyltransferase TrmB [Verrucomicrobiota bacterium]